MNVDGLEYQEDGAGNLLLSDIKFERDEFESLTLGASLGARMTWQNIQLINCRTTEGTCMIMPNAVLRNVLFTNFRCGDALRADSSSIYERVTFVGRYPNRLIFRPDDWDRYVMPDETGIDYHFDIRDFKGEVELVGFRGKKVLKDPSRHVTIKAAWMNEVDWSGLGIQKLGLFRICARKLSGSKAEEEVFSLPKLTEKRYEQEMQDYERLKAAGVQFD